MNVFATDTHLALTTRVLWLHDHAVPYLDTTGLCDFDDFASGFMSKVFASASRCESFIFCTHGDGVNFNNNDISCRLRVGPIYHASFTLTKHCCNLHKIY
jgi:hypothetical protein